MSPTTTRRHFLRLVGLGSGCALLAACGPAAPALATAWEPSPDGSAWTFHLRPNVKFHDGTPFTSQAVKTTIEHLLDRDTLSTRRAQYTPIKPIHTPAHLTVRFTT